MSGVKKTASSGGKAKAPVQANNLMSMGFFGKPKPAPAPATAATATAPTTPPRAGASAATSASSADPTASFFSSAPIAALPSTRVMPPTPPAASATTPSKAAPSSGAKAATASSSGVKVKAEFELSSSGRKRKTIAYNEEDDEDESTSAPPSSAKKQRRKTKDDDEYGSDGGASDSDDAEMHDEPSDEDEPVVKSRAAPASSGKKKAAPSSASKGKAAPSSAGKKAAASKKAAGSDDEDGGFGGGGDNEDETAGHGGKDYNTDFLLPQNRRDKKGVRLGQPGYDATTLHISEAVMSKFTPAERQYWEIKSNNMDLVIFFKIGKFYEMFDEDAAVGVKELDLSYMTNQKRPHSGFPEAALNKYAEKLVSLGYKIGQVDQTETPEMLKAANAKLAKGQKKRSAVHRQLSTVLTPGTLVDGAVLGSDDANYLLALTEEPLSAEAIAAQKAEYAAAVADAAHGLHARDELQALEDHSNDTITLGFTFVDCTTGRFTVGQHRDDQQRSFLKTLLGFVAPREIVLPGTLSNETQFVLRHELREGVVRNDGAEFWTAQQTVRELHAKKYFAVPVKKEGASAKKEGVTLQSTADTVAHWPLALQHLVGAKQDLAMSAFGATVCYLRRTLHDFELLSQAHVRSYFGAGDEASTEGRVLALDGQTLANLEVVRNQRGGVTGTLLEFVDRARTPFGKRRLRDWLIKPLFGIDAITQRQDAVAFFMAHPELSEKLRDQIKQLPDLERNLSRIHANGIKKAVVAIMYTDVSAKQLDVFLKTLDGFAKVATMLRQFENVDPKAPGLEAGSRLRALLTKKASGGLLPDFEPALATVRSSFDPKKAKEEKSIKPNPGLSPEYDECVEQVEEVERELAAYLKSIQKKFGDSNIKWIHKNKERYQIEFPIRTSEKVTSDEFAVKSASKTCKRYWTPQSIELADRLAALLVDRELHEKDMSRTVFATFAQDYALWSGTVEVVGELDCLLSLALVSKHHLGCVRPSFVAFEANGSSKLDLRGAVHPALYESVIQNRMKQSASFIANDTVIGCEENPARFVLVSGPNMGGKSTLLRQTCCAVILAQMGCWVPAESCSLTPVDRIFTRVGANDKIMQGLSTFLVELVETSHILKNATPRSLVILDELGRGTSTFDGTAIAYAVIRYLSQKTGCLTLFATHYHMLMDEFASDPLLSMYHMACQVNSTQTDVTFLYKFIPGVCPKSYGSNVAKAAGLPDHVLQRAQHMSEQFEKRCVEAMGNNRAHLLATFSAQKSSDVFELPVSTSNSLASALEAEDCALLLQFAEGFAISNRTTSKAAEAKTHGTNGTEFKTESKMQE